MPGVVVYADGEVESLGSLVGLTSLATIEPWPLLGTTRESDRPRHSTGRDGEEPSTMPFLRGQSHSTFLHGFRHRFRWQVRCIWYPCVVSLAEENHLSQLLSVGLEPLVDLNG